MRSNHIFMKKIIYLFIVSILFSCTKEQEKVKLSGPVFGTAFNIQYYTYDNANYEKEFDSLYDIVNASIRPVVTGNALIFALAPNLIAAKFAVALDGVIINLGPAVPVLDVNVIG